MEQNDNKSIFTLIILALLVLAIPLTVFVAKKSAELRNRAAGGTANLTIAPNTASHAIGESFDVHVWLDSTTQKITFAQLALSFTNLELTNIVTTDKLPTAIKTTSIADANSGSKLIMVRGAETGKTPPSGAIDFATLTFKGKAVGSAALSFLNSEIQIVQTDNQEMAPNSSNATFTINTGGGEGATESSLSFSPTSVTKTIGTAFNSNVALNVNAKQISYAAVKVTFDKTVLNVASAIQTTSKMGTVIKKTSPTDANTSGVIEIVLGVPGGESAVTGSITDFAVIPLKGIKNGASTLAFDRNGVQIVATDNTALTFSASTAQYTISSATAPTPTPTPTKKPYPTAFVTVNPTFTATTPTPTEILDPNKPTPTLPAGSTTLNLKVKVNGLNAKPARSEDIQQIFKVTLVNKSGQNRSYPAILRVDANANTGLFSGRFDITDFVVMTPDLAQSQTKLFVKWSKSLQKKYTVLLSKGENNIDLTTNAKDYLDACDVPDPNNNYQQDGMCNSVDYTLVQTRIGANSADDLRVADLNLDGAINGIDVNILVNAIFTRYEDEIE